MEHRGVENPGGLTRERRRGALYDNYEALWPQGPDSPPGERLAGVR
jgi:hypothetical protein